LLLYVRCDEQTDNEALWMRASQGPCPPAVLGPSKYIMLLVYSWIVVFFVSPLGVGLQDVMVSIERSGVVLRMWLEDLFCTKIQSL
jgi:hypothetical protein